jgi:hypothetical protein
VLGKEHPNTLSSVNNLALILDRQGKHKEAEEMLQRILTLMETVLGEEHPDTLASVTRRLCHAKPAKEPTDKTQLDERRYIPLSSVQ